MWRKFWFWFPFGLAFGFIVYWLLRRRLLRSLTSTQQEDISLPRLPVVEPITQASQPPLTANAVRARPIRQEQAPAKAVKPRRPVSKPKDDLTRIWGIGPKYAALLQKAGILSFEQLAQADPKSLKRILEDGGARFRRIETWMEQAKLAAVKDWQSLDAYQKKLKSQ